MWIESQIGVLKRCLLWYLGRRPVVLKGIENQSDFIEFLERSTRRVEKKSKLSRAGLRYRDRGIFFYEDNEEIVICCKTGFLPNPCFFKGEFNLTRFGVVLAGSHRCLLALEVMLTALLCIVAYAMLSYIYGLFTGRPSTFSAAAIVLIGFPIFLLYSRWMLVLWPFLGKTGARKIDELLKSYTKRVVDEH